MKTANFIMCCLLIVLGVLLATEATAQQVTGSGLLVTP